MRTIINIVDDVGMYVCCSELKKLSEESLTRQPEEVFDIICKLGEGSYGSVYKVRMPWTTFSISQMLFAYHLHWDVGIL